MSLVKTFAWLIFSYETFAYQNSYILYQENVSVVYVNEALINIHAAEVYPLNETIKALNISGTITEDVPENGRVHITAYKWAKDDYRHEILHLGRSFTAAIQMESFGLNVLCQEYFRPPVVWPVKKGTYQSTGWSPDSTKFPPNLPSGKYKVQLSFQGADRAKFLAVDWFIKIVYKK